MKIKILLVLSVATALLASAFFVSRKAYSLNQSFYIDCSAGIDGDGSLGTPWNTPLSLFQHQQNPGAYTFGGGDQILIRRGTTCNYPVRLVRGAGTAGNPITIGDYGDPGDPAPIINGSGQETDNWDGESISSAIQIYDSDNLIIEDLEITNTGGDPLDGRRQGIQVFAVERYGAHANITIRNNYIHDIVGEYKKNHEATAGILIEQRLPPVGLDPTPDPTWFENITIEDNVIEDTYRQGINLWGDWRNRDEDGYDPTGPAWTAWTGVVIQNNQISGVRGDGILVSNTDGAIVRNNTLQGFNELNGLPESEIMDILSEAQTKQGLASLPSRRHAGIWTYNADNTVIEGNDVRGGVSNEDGMSYDIDGGSIGTTIQYNYSQDNEGGFLLICNEIGEIRDGIVRYNISKNDGFASITTCVGEVLNTAVYNNTIYSTEQVDYPFRQVDWVRFGGDTMDDSRDIDIANNIFAYPGQDIEHFFYNEREGSGLLEDTVDADTTADNNLFYGVGTPAKDSAALEGRPRFNDVSLEAAGFTLRANSPAYEAGATIAGNGGVDYFGSALSSPYNVGADESVPPATALWYVGLPDDSRLSVIRKSDSADASDGLEEPGSGEEDLAVVITEGGKAYRIAEFTAELTADIDLSTSGFDFDSETGAVVVHNLASLSGVAGGQYDMLLPKLEGGELPIGVCPGAESIDELDINCGGFYSLGLDDSALSEITISGQDYYKISGLSGTGAFYVEGLADTGLSPLTQSLSAAGLTVAAVVLYKLNVLIYTRASNEPTRPVIPKNRYF